MQYRLPLRLDYVLSCIENHPNPRPICWQNRRRSLVLDISHWQGMNCESPSSPLCPTHRTLRWFQALMTLPFKQVRPSFQQEIHATSLTLTAFETFCGFGNSDSWIIGHYMSRTWQVISLTSTLVHQFLPLSVQFG